MVVLVGFVSSVVVVVVSSVVVVVDGGIGMLVVVLVSGGGLVVDGCTSDVVVVVLIGSLVDADSVVDEDVVVDDGSSADVVEISSLVVVGVWISLLLLGSDVVGSMLSVDWLGGILVELLSVGDGVLVGSLLPLSLGLLV